MTYILLLRDKPGRFLILLMAVLLCGCAPIRPRAVAPHEQSYTCSGEAPFWNPELKLCQNVQYCPPQGCAPTPAKSSPEKWVGPWPQGIDCGVPVKFTDGSEWIFPCWPEKNIPRCIKGRQPDIPPEKNVPRGGKAKSNER